MSEFFDGGETVICTNLIFPADRLKAFTVKARERRLIGYTGIITAKPTLDFYGVEDFHGNLAVFHRSELEVYNSRDSEGIKILQEWLS